MRTVHFLLFNVMLFLTGCATYEFDVTEPPDLAAHVGRKEATQATLQRDPLTYVMRAVEGRLVVHVENDSSTPIELLGGRSYVVDPGEQSRALPTFVIAPNSYVKLVLPPLRTYAPARPTFGFGIGVGISRATGRRGYSTGTGVGYGTEDSVYLADAPGNLFWEWEGETPVRIRLTYQREDETFVHEFTVRRVKVK